MESIWIHPESTEQLKAVKAFLKALKVPFEAQTTDLPDHVKASIEKGLKQFEDGQTIPLDEFKNRHFSNK